MNPEENQYHFSFFKPSTDSARRNRNMVVQLVLIWVVAIFGFQFLLKILEKPVPEETHNLYSANWPAIVAGDYERTNLQACAQASLSVAGKIAIQDDHHAALNHAISWFALEIADSAQGAELKTMLGEFEAEAANISDISDAAYVQKKEALYPLLSELFGLSVQDVRTKIAPLEMKVALMTPLGDDDRKLIEAAMDKYLIHNRSALTDALFLGFPFHYFYTAVFLLILFVGLCWLYCFRTDMFNKKYGIED